MRKIFILLLLMVTCYHPLQGKKGLGDHTSYTVSHVKAIQSPFLRHTEGCRAIGIVWHRMSDDQVWYGIYYHAHLSRSTGLRLSGGVAPVKVNYKKHIRWVITPSIFYTFFSTYAHDYISLSLGSIIAYGPYQSAIFGLPDQNSWDMSITLAAHYTFYFHKDWAFGIGIGPCIGLLKDKGVSGVLVTLCLQYNL